MTTSILLVEDDDDIRVLLTALLRTEGYDVQAAENGADALDALSGKPPPDVIVFDLMMPLMNGWEFRKIQRRTPEIQAIPVIMISGINDVERASSRLDPNAMLQKPLDPDDLIDAVRACV